MEQSNVLKQILVKEAEVAFTITERLFRKINDNELSWKPETGNNWMTIGQLLMHCANFGCGKAVKGFITGDWGFPEAAASTDSGNDANLPPANVLPTVNSVANALDLLAEDKQLTMNHFNELDEERLLIERLTAPWGGPETTLFQHLLMMIEHLTQHKGQLFYYLKLMGQDVNTTDLWGM
ncbi:MAG: DinB family protein [bacterium]